MPTTTRNALRIPAEGDSPDVPRDIGNLANDVDVKMVSWWEGTHAARPVPGQVNRMYKETDTGYLWHDTGAAWEPVIGPGMSGAYTARVEVLKEVTGSGTESANVNSPSATRPVFVNLDFGLTSEPLFGGIAELRVNGVLMQQFFLTEHPATEHSGTFKVRYACSFVLPPGGHYTLKNTGGGSSKITDGVFASYMVL